MNELTNDANRIRPVLQLQEPATQVCLLWPEWPATDHSRSDQTLIGSHRTGGAYTVTPDAKAYLEDHQDEMFGKRARITSWLVEQRYQGVDTPEITVELIQSFSEDDVISIEQGAFNLLRYLAFHGPIGHPYQLRDDRDLVRKNEEILRQRGNNILTFFEYARCLAATECQDWHDLGVYMDQLQESGYVRKTAMTDRPEWNQYSVTFSGYQAARGNTSELLNPETPSTANQIPTDSQNLNSREVFVIHGRNETARMAIFDFLTSVGLEPIEWDTAVKATESAAPYIGQILDAAFNRCNAVVAVMTPDDTVELKDWLQREDDPQEEKMLMGQARPNVIFETGMAMAKFQEKTIIVEIGNPKRFSDLAGRHTLRLSDTSHCRRSIVQRLETAGCPVDLNRPHWEQAGDFRTAINTADSGQTSQTRQSEQPVDSVDREIAVNHLNDKAKELITQSAAGEGDYQGFIDDYRYMAGGKPIEPPDTPQAKAELEEATEQLLRNELATRLIPKHMQDRRGLQLTDKGYRVADLLDPTG